MDVMDTCIDVDNLEYLANQDLEAWTLHIFMDSCYAGAWAQEACRLGPAANIAVFAACQAGEVQAGGAFTLRLLGLQLRIRDVVSSGHKSSDELLEKIYKTPLEVGTSPECLCLELAPSRRLRFRRNAGLRAMSTISSQEEAETVSSVPADDAATGGGSPSSRPPPIPPSLEVFEPPPVKNTFIHFDDDAPQPDYTSTVSGPAVLRSVASPPQRRAAEGRHNETLAEADECQDEDEEQASQAALPSIGSAGHAAGTCRPCAHAWSHWEPTKTLEALSPMALAMSPAGCCKQPLFEMDAKSAHEVSEAPDVPLGMQPKDDGLLLDGQIASPNDDPDLMRALWRVQEQQLSSLDALRKLRSQHQEWQRTIQDMVRQVTVQLPRKGSEFSVKSSGQPDAPTATSPKLSNAADEDPMKTQETENVIQTPEEPSRHQMLSPWQVLFNQNKPKTVKMSTTNKLKRFDDYSLFPSDWQRWIDHLVEKAQEKPEFDGSVWTACRVYAYRVVSRRSFEHFVGFLIALNLILQGAETEMDLRDPDGLTRSFFAMVDMAFNVVYCLEIFLRFVAGGLGVLCDTWFLADTVLVLLGVSASIFSVSGGTSARQFIVVRGLRLLRLGRAIRMTKKFKVVLLSGSKAIVEARLDESVETLKNRAQTALEVGRGRLLDSSGRALVGSSKIIDSSVRSGDCLSLHLSRVQIQASLGAFAAILGDGSVVTWGLAVSGGDSSAVQDQLKNVQQIQASGGAFAAILGDGSVVTWGKAVYGGDSSAVQDQLKNVQQIQASDYAFAAILGDGSVVTWGDADRGGDSSAVQDQLTHVQQIQASDCAFAAILDDGSVVTWGKVKHGGDSSTVQDQLKNVQQIQASDNANAFAAILDDGSVLTWGIAAHGGDSSAVQEQLKNVQQIQASGGAFAAILGDGSVVTWGIAAYGGDCSAVEDWLKNA
ncbi:E3 ubiquitin-protein ligase HERC2 [Symbiodinium microadriaticum]|uniref:E3 ubiquitin-protein ligase HERC2 n=1 Tax=Symbiodinium microadriaticum TaxID=2951 RepID=A0A1Q9DRP0_SYMMI|nr:E3 ubiquitin-protein ligase HERC2 [Symbiodinium microadriaticum]